MAMATAKKNKSVKLNEVMEELAGAGTAVGAVEGGAVATGAGEGVDVLTLDGPVKPAPATPLGPSVGEGVPTVN